MRKELDKRVANLSDAKRRLLEERLKGKNRRAPKPGRASDDHPTAVPATPGPTAEVPAEAKRQAPLAPPQKRLWFLDRHADAGAAYHVMAAWWVDGSVDVPALDRAFCKLVTRHHALRTRFPLVDGEPRQVLEAPPTTLLTTCSVEPDCLTAWCQDELKRSFDLAEGPLLRVSLVRLSPRRSLLVICAHHLVIDGWSIGLLHRELDLFYRGADASLPPLTGDYFTICSEWDQALRDNRFQGQRDYWTDHLAGAPTVHALPLDKPRPAQASYRGAHLRFEMDQPRREALQQLAVRHGCSSFCATAALFALLLYKSSDSDDLVFGVPFAGRAQPQRQGLIGFFVNTLALRFDLAGSPSFAALLARVRDVTTAAFDHADVPFDQVVETLAPSRDAAVAPLVQIMFSYQTLPEESTRLGDLRLTPFEVEADVAQVDLALTLTEDPASGWCADFEYNTELFVPATLAAMSRAYIALLDACLANPETPIDLVSAVPADDAALLCRPPLRVGNPSGEPLLLHQGVFSAAQRDPDALAVWDQDGCLSYQGLTEQALQIAAGLVALGVGPETLVGVYLPTTLTRVPAVLGVLAAGAAYLPLDPQNPDSRLAHILDDARPRVLLGRDLPSGLQRMVDAAGIALVDPDRLTGCRKPMLEKPVAVDAANLAYVIYTSGSTGRPKGVAVPHGAVARFIGDALRQYETRVGDRLLRFAAFGFDVAVEDIFVTLWGGATLVGAPVEKLEIPTLLAAVAAQKMTILSLPTAFWRELTEVLSTGAVLPPSVRLVVIGGEALPPGDLVCWRALGYQRVTLINAYGPTESTAAATMAVFAGPGALDGSWLDGCRNVPIGEACPSSAMVVVDEAGRLQPIGVPGELWIGGGTLARGYLGNPRLTAERFTPNPFAAQPGERVYRSGDVVRRLPGERGAASRAVYTFLRRVDRQLKIRGFRIEPGEIEAALQNLPGVAHAVVFPHEQKGLAAHWVASGETSYSPDSLAAALREVLPAYMVPDRFRQWPAFPMHNGKIARKALHASADTVVDAAVGVVVAPRTLLEFQLHEMWSALLPKQTLGVTDDFFQRGGHSLLAVRFMTQARQKWGRDMALAHFFKDPTIAGCAAFFQEEGSVAAFDHVVPLKSQGDGAPLFCVHSQRGQVWAYGNLARVFPENHPFYGVQALGPEFGSPLTDVGQMAEIYWRAMSAVWPNGPVHLAGWSFGGVVAHHIAGLAEADGREVGFLGLFDSEAPTEHSRCEDELDLLGMLLDTFTAETRARLQALDSAQRLDWVVTEGLRTKRFPSYMERPAIIRYLRTMLCHNTAFHAHQPSPIQAPIHFFKAADPDDHDRAFRPVNPEQDWRPLTREGVTVHLIPGSHMDMMKPEGVEHITPIISQCLAEAPLFTTGVGP